MLGVHRCRDVLQQLPLNLLYSHRGRAQEDGLLYPGKAIDSNSSVDPPTPHKLLVPLHPGRSGPTRSGPYQWTRVGGR